MDVSVLDLKNAIESQHGASATLRHAMTVIETFEGQPVWEGVVHVFDLRPPERHSRLCVVVAHRRQ